MQLPKISLIAPSHRTHIWKPFFDSIVSNHPIEINFVSDIEPKEGEVPESIPGVKEFRYWISPIKPAQCFEWAYRQSTGAYIIWCGDDVMYAPYAFDQAFTFHQSFHDHKVISIIRFFEDGNEATYYHKLPWDDKVQLACTALINRNAITEVGGLGDRYFVTGHWDADLMMRIYANGGRGFVCPLACAYEPHIAFHKKEANFAENWRMELDYFTELWKLGQKTTFERQHPFAPYKEENLLTISQGNKGKWA